MFILLRYTEHVYQKVLLSEAKYVQINTFNQYTTCERIMQHWNFFNKSHFDT